MRFDVPVIGVETIRIATEAKLRVIAVEARRTLFTRARHNRRSCGTREDFDRCSLAAF
jgi:DUF1009 family protein